MGVSDDLRGAVVAACVTARTIEQPTIAAAGAQNLLDQPEFQDLRKLRSILRIVEEQKTLYQIVADAMNSDAASVKIGHELGSEEFADLSVVTVPYRFGAHALGMLSILGPRRMPYGRLLALATGTAQSLEPTALGRRTVYQNHIMPTKDYYEILGVARWRIGGRDQTSLSQVGARAPSRRRARQIAGRTSFQRNQRGVRGPVRSK